MNDTPQHIKELQLKIWLSKSPAERLKQFLEDNEALYKFWDKTKELNKVASEETINGIDDNADSRKGFDRTSE
jgi:hypothetical protein